MTISRDDRVVWRDAFADRRDISQCYCCVVHNRDDNRVQVFRLLRLTADNREFQLVVFLHQSGRRDDVCLVHRVHDLLERDASRYEPAGINGDVKLALLSAGYGHRRNAGEPCESRSDDISRKVPQTRGVTRV